MPHSQYRIYSHPVGEQITIAKEGSNQPTDTLLVENLAALLNLRKRINAYIDTLEPDGDADQLPASATPQLITTKDAIRLAHRENRNLPETTLRNAITRKQLPAQKRGGRWYVDQNQFLDWLRDWPRR